jgi:hypothetical protein
MSEYTVSCNCGTRVSVAARQAGSTVSCSCGQTISIPLLSALRRSAGQTTKSTLELVQEMVRTGELPIETVCPISGRQADETILFHIQCERSWVRGGEPFDLGKIMAYYLLFGWIGALIASRKMEAREEFGRDTFLTVPVRISGEVRAKIFRTRRQKTMKSYLLHVSIYARLLREYPDAVVTPTSPGSEKSEV